MTHDHETRRPVAMPAAGLTMTAAICPAYGPPEVLRLAEVPRPVPGDGEILVRIEAASVSTADWRMRALAMPRGFGLIARLIFGLRRPRTPVLGTELSGTVVETGRAVTRFRPGDQVVAYVGTGLNCHAGYRTLAETGPVIPRPSTLSHAEAAAMSFGGCTALAFLRDKGGIRAGQRVMVIGASGSVGSAAIQIARHFGAEVTAVASAANHDLVRSLGAHHAIDYRTEDFAAGPLRYDLVLDAVGAATFAQARPILAEHGRFLMVAADLPQMLQAAFARGSRRPVAGPVGEKVEDMRFLADLAEAGAYRPFVEQAYPLEDIAAAHARVESGRKRGNVVVLPGGGTA